MKFIVHVVVEISNHKQVEDRFEIVEVENERGEKCHVFRTDAFYLVEEDTALDSVVHVINSIKVINSENESVPLSSALKIVKKEAPESSRIVSSYNSYSYSNETDSELFFATCEFQREDEHDKWIEFHRLSIYVMEEQKIVKVQKNGL